MDATNHKKVSSSSSVLLYARWELLLDQQIKLIMASIMDTISKIIISSVYSVFCTIMRYNVIVTFPDWFTFVMNQMRRSKLYKDRMCGYYDPRVVNPWEMYTLCRYGSPWG